MVPPRRSPVPAIDQPGVTVPSGALSYSFWRLEEQPVDR